MEEAVRWLSFTTGGTQPDETFGETWRGALKLTSFSRRRRTGMCRKRQDFETLQRRDEGQHQRFEGEKGRGEEGYYKRSGGVSRAITGGLSTTFYGRGRGKADDNESFDNTSDIGSGWTGIPLKSLSRKIVIETTTTNKCIKEEGSGVKNMLMLLTWTWGKRFGGI